ncbi:aminoacyl-tRNA hydrolase [Candidatus Peregrinibacteria bacterium]|nr:aminoacyl-tRNA hydrolase [Candidatus Peregrinibacteria bacterium]
MKIILGLGNPGPEYSKTRHNSGFLVLDKFAELNEFPNFKPEKKFRADVSVGFVNNEKIILAKPTTYMNLSGYAALQLRDFFKVKNDDIWVVYDDLDLQFGKIRVRPSGSAGTHNGLKSIIQTLNATDIPRFRIGIESRGHMTEPKISTNSFVLSKYSKEESLLLNNVLENASKAVLHGIKYGIIDTMNEFN